MSQAPPEKADITGLVLAGGRGTRVGSADKGLLPFQNQPLFMHAAARLKPQVSALLVNANRNLDRYARAGFAVISDEDASFAGPLAGFATGLKHCQTSWLAVVPCDSPFFPETLVQKLGKALAKTGADMAIAVTGMTPPFTPQPVFCLMRRDILSHLNAFLKTGGRKIDDWYASLNVAEARFPDESAFYNINTLKALENLEKQTGNNT